MFQNPSDSSPRWWLAESGDPDSHPCASSIVDHAPLTRPFPFVSRNREYPEFSDTPLEWTPEGTDLHGDAGRAFQLSSGPRELILYQPRRSETNAAVTWDLVVRFPQCTDILEIRSDSQPIPYLMEIPQGTPVVLVGSENAWAIRMRATHPDLQGIPLRFEETGEGLFLVLHLADFGRERHLRDEDLLRYSTLVTLEEKRLNNPRALEGFEHDLANQEVWDDLIGPSLRKAGFIGNGFKLTGTLDPIGEAWVNRLVVGE